MTPKDQFKYNPTQNPEPVPLPTIISRAQTLVNQNLTSVTLEDLIKELRLLRMGVHRITKMMKNNYTADEQTMNQLLNDYHFLEKVKDRLLSELSKREIERNSHKEALESRPDSFLDNNDMIEMEEEDEEETPQKNQSPKTEPKVPEQVPMKFLLKLGENLGPEVIQELTKQGDDYYRKLKDGTRIKLNSEVEIKDEDDGNVCVKKKIITLSMPRENKPIIEGLRKSHSESNPKPNIQINPNLYRRHDSEKEKYNDKGYDVCNNQFSPHDSGVPQNMNNQPSQEVNSKESQREDGQGFQSQQEDHENRFKKQQETSNFEEISGENMPDIPWRGHNSGKPQEFDYTMGSNGQTSDLRSNHEMQMPFPDSGIRGTNENSDIINKSRPEDVTVIPKKKNSVKKLIMSEHKFDESYTNMTEDNKPIYDVYNNSLEPSNPMTRQESQEQVEPNEMNRVNTGLTNKTQDHVDIYSKNPTKMSTEMENEEMGLNDTNRKFYTNQSSGKNTIKETLEIDQQNETSKKPFYPNRDSAAKKNTLNDLIGNNNKNNHRSRMNELSHVREDIGVNLESLQTVNSNWISGREESGHDSINYTNNRQRSHFGDRGNPNIKSLNEIVNESVSRQKDEENVYYNYNPNKLERISHPDDYMQHKKKQEMEVIKPEPVKAPSGCVRYVPISEYEEPKINRNSQKFGVKEKRLSHKSKMIVLPATSRRFDTGSKSRGVSLDDYNKRASSLTSNKNIRYSIKASNGFKETTTKNKITNYNPVNDDYGITCRGITNEMRRSSDKKRTKELGRGTRVTRPEFAVKQDDRMKGISVYTGEEAMSRSRHTLSSGRNNRSQNEYPSPGIRRVSRGRRGSSVRPNNFRNSKEVKIRVRGGNRSIIQNDKPYKSNNNISNTMNNLGNFFDRRMPSKMVESIKPNNPQKLSINQMINRGRSSMNRIGPKKLARSISREVSQRVGSHSSLKHEVKIRSISRSRNLVNLDEYCHKIERESRHMDSQSKNNGSEIKFQKRKLNNLLNNLKNMKSSQKINNDYYALGNDKRRRVQKKRETPKVMRPREYTISETKLRKIRQMFPFNQEWFWNLSLEKQENNLHKHNPQIVQKLKIPVNILISKVKQSESINDSWIIDPKKDKIIDSFANKEVEFSRNSRPPRKCRNFESQNSQYHSERNEEYGEIEEKKMGLPPKPEEEEDDDFGNFDFNKKRQQNEILKNVPFKDKHYMDNFQEKEVKSSRFIGGYPGNNSNPYYQRSERTINVRGNEGESRTMRNRRNDNTKTQNDQNRSNHMNGSKTLRYSSHRKANSKFDNRVRIRNKHRNYNNNNFVSVNRHVIPMDHRRQQATRTSQTRVPANDPKKVNFTNQGSHVYTERNQNNSNNVYNDRFIIQKDPQDIEEDFDDDYFEERNKNVNIQRNVYKRKQHALPKPKITKREIPEEAVFVEKVNIQNDESEDFDDDYFEEQDLYLKRKKKVNGKRQDEKRYNNRPPKREDSPDIVYQDKMEIKPEEGNEEDYDDDYYEERDSKTWKNRKHQDFSNENQEQVTKNYFKKGQYVNHNREESPERVYVEPVHIQNEDSDEDYEDDYFEERDAPQKRANNQKNRTERPRQHKPKQPKTSNIFKNSKIGSGINYDSKNSSHVQSNVSNSKHIISGRFKSFAPISNQNSQIPKNETVEFAHIESTNYGDPDPKMVGKEIKGPRGKWDSRGHSQAYDSAKKTAYTSNSMHQENHMESNDVKFKDPYQAQIFSNQESYRRNQNRQQVKSGNSFGDYYQTRGDKHRF